MNYFYSEEIFDFKQPLIDETFFSLSAENQLENIKKNNLPQYPTPAVIYNRSVFEDIGFLFLIVHRCMIILIVIP